MSFKSDSHSGLLSDTKTIVCHLKELAALLVHLPDKSEDTCCLKELAMLLVCLPNKPEE